MRMINIRKTDWTLLRMGFALLVSFSVLTVCSKNSFLYRAVDTCSMVFEGLEWTYTLYERIGD